MGIRSRIAALRSFYPLPRFEAGEGGDPSRSDGEGEGGAGKQHELEKPPHSGPRHFLYPLPRFEVGEGGDPSRSDGEGEGGAGEQHELEKPPHPDPLPPSRGEGEKRKECEKRPSPRPTQKSF